MDAGITAGAEATPSFFINGVKIVGAQPYTIFKDALDKELAGTVTDERVDVEVGHFPVMGNANAAIKIVEFSDFECPFCRRFYEDTLPLIKKNYIDTGKAALYYRHEPLSIHPMAKPFAKAAECANEQNKFWEMHDLIFKKQS
ncbi:MAG: DsbA family protein [Candidatus Levybacteria bacterium]|nr:DsbA family protein [Candidatus Levybacteria bacterium]